MKNLLRSAALLGSVTVLGGCATLGLAIQPPSFSVEGTHAPELRLLPPSMQHPMGGAALRLHARVQNPNAVGITLSRLAGTLQLQGARAAEVDFPLGVPLQANGEAVVPMDIAISLQDVPGLADVLLRAVTGQNVGYRLDGIVGVDAGVFGQPSFGPMNIVAGEVRVVR